MPIVAEGPPIVAEGPPILAEALPIAAIPFGVRPTWQILADISDYRPAPSHVSMWEPFLPHPVTW